MITIAAFSIGLLAGMFFMACLVAARKPTPTPTDDEMDAEVDANFELAERVAIEERDAQMERIATRIRNDRARFREVVARVQHESKLDRDVAEAVAHAEAAYRPS